MAPNFWEMAADAYRTSVAHSFLVYGAGVADYATEDSAIDLPVWLTRALVQTFDLVMLYDPANGITFPLPQMKRLFEREVLGKEEADGNKKSANPLMAAMAGAIKTQETDLRLSVAEALPLLDKALTLVSRKPDDRDTFYRVALIFTMADLTFPQVIGPLPPTLATAYAFVQTWARNPVWRAKNAPMIFYLSPDISDVADAVRENCYTIKAAAPTYDQRLRFAEFALNANDVELADDMTLHRLAALTAGLLRIHIEDVIVRARINKTALTAAMVKERKDEIMQARFAGVLETIEATGSLDDIAGLDYLKTYLLNEIVLPMRNGETAGVPMGVLMAGPPGTGKTYIAEKLAASAGVNFVLFRMANILGSYVGESEKNLERALQGIQELTPCIVFIDEVEQSIKRDTGNAGNSVMGNLFGRLLNAIGDTRYRGRVVWLMATNRPDLLDPAFKRSGRIDAKFAVMPPDNPAERAEMFRLMARKNNVQLGDDVDLLAIAERIPDYTGADIEVITLKASKIARKRGHERVAQSDLEYAVSAIRIPQSAQTRMMIAAALAEVNDLDNLPPSYRERMLAGEFETEIGVSETSQVREERIL